MRIVTTDLRRRRRRLTAATILVLAASLTQSFGVIPGLLGTSAATSLTWTGAGTTTKWSDGANWDTGTPPTNGDAVVFPPYSVTSPVASVVDDITALSLSGLTINDGYAFTATNGAVVTLTGVLTLATQRAASLVPPFAIPIVSTLAHLVIQSGFGPYPIATTVSDPGGVVDVNSDNIRFVSGGIAATAITVTNCELWVDQGASVGAAPITVSSNGSLGLGPGVTLSNPITLLADQGGAGLALDDHAVLAGPLTLEGNSVFGAGIAAGVGTRIDGAITGTGQLSLAALGLGAGDILLSRANPFTGGTVIHGNQFTPFTVTAGATGALGPGAIALVGDAALNIASSSSTWTNPVNFNDFGDNDTNALHVVGPSAVTWSGPITDHGGGAVTIGALSASGSLTVTGGLFGSGCPSIDGAGTVTIAGTVANAIGASPVQLNGPAHLILDNPPNLTAWGAGDVVLQGAGAVLTTLNDGQVAGHFSLGPGTAMDIGATAQSLYTLTLSGGSLSGTGALVTSAVIDTQLSGASDRIAVSQVTMTPGAFGGSPSITTAGAALEIDSNLVGTAGLSIGSGPGGEVILTGQNTVSGPTDLTGTLAVYGSQPQSPITINTTGYLGGSGTVGDVSSVGGVLAPDGQMHTSSVTLDAASAFGTSVYGSRAGSDYGQLIPNGPVNLGNASLIVDIQYTPSIGDSFTLISDANGTPIVGTFNGLPEGIHFADGAYTLAITYHGGAGHDVVATVTNLAFLQLDDFGGLHHVGGAAIDVSGAPYWSGWNIARGVVVRHGNDGGYELDGWGGVHPFGAAPAAAATAYWPGWDIARGLTLRPDGRSGYVVDGWGAVHPFGGAPNVYASGWWPGHDLARGIAQNPCDPSGNSGYVLDAYGGVHPFGGAPTVTASASWPGWPIARSIATDYQCDGGVVLGWVLDGWGGIHPFVQQGYVNPASPSQTAYWLRWDIARALVVTGPEQGYVLDAWGGIHPFGGAAVVTGGGYWPGWDILRGGASP